MKICYPYLLGILVLFGFSNCANGKKLQSEAPVIFKPAYYTTWIGGTKGAGAGFNLYLPISSENTSNIKLDSIYFRGKKAKLQTKPQMPNLYIAYFNSEENELKVPELVMSSDPKEEYGNSAPTIKKEIPFELEPDEAVISYKRNGKTYYYKISGIEKREKDEVPIKKPKNIQH